MANQNDCAIGKVVQVAGPAVDCEFPEGRIPLVHTAIRITSEGFHVPQPIDIICEAEHFRTRSSFSRITRMTRPSRVPPATRFRMMTGSRF